MALIATDAAILYYRSRDMGSIAGYRDYRAWYYGCNMPIDARRLTSYIMDFSERGHGRVRTAIRYRR